MKNYLNLCLAVVMLSVSNLGHAIPADKGHSATVVDAYTALQQTRCTVYADLEKHLQSGFESLSLDIPMGFGIDDVKSYSRQDAKPLGQLGFNG